MAVTWKPSPNYDGNRTKIDTIFIHWIVGTLAAADAVFARSGGTSAHYGVEDNTIHQYVSEQNVAYHAGVYSWNQRSVGIEHSADPNRPASEATYQTSGKLIAEIAKRHSIPLDRTYIKGHKEVKATQCPGTMDIDKLIRIAKGSVPSPTPTLPEPNPGYMPTHTPQTVEKDGKTYESYKDANGKLLWKVRPSGLPDDYKGKYEALVREFDTYKVDKGKEITQLNVRLKSIKDHTANT